MLDLGGCCDALSLDGRGVGVVNASLSCFSPTPGHTWLQSQSMSLAGRVCLPLQFLLILGRSAELVPELF